MKCKLSFKTKRKKTIDMSMDYRTGIKILPIQSNTHAALFTLLESLDDVFKFTKKKIYTMSSLRMKLIKLVSDKNKN